MHAMKQPIPFADGVWLDCAPVNILGMGLTSTMTVLRLPDGLLLHSPIPMTDERRTAVANLGPVKHLFAPNLFHHMWLNDWISAFPEARVHAPAGLAKKRPDLRIDRVHAATPEPAFEGILDEVVIEGFRLEETALFFRPQRVLVVADLVHNIGRPPGLWTKAYATAMGFYDRVALSRVIRWTSFADRKAARRSIDRLFSLDFQRLVVGHGDPIEANTQRILEAAYRWLE